MSEYVYKLRNYHAIESAEIALKGITVLSGENGCGKSTLSRWLYYLVNGSYSFEEYVNENYRQTLLSALRKLERITREFGMYDREDNRSVSANRPPSVFAFSHRIKRDKTDVEVTYETRDFYLSFINDFAKRLEQYLEQPGPVVRKKRALEYILKNDVDENMEPAIVIDMFHGRYIQILADADVEMAHALEERPLSILLDLVSNKYDEDDKAPQEIEFYEDGVNVLADSSVSDLYNLSRAIYVDTPLSLSDHATGNPFWEELKEYVNGKSFGQSLQQKKLLHRIRTIMHGSAVMQKTDSAFADEELRYVSEDKGVNIEIEKTATGFKTFIYLQRLLENDYLDKETLLLIDEPEVHLHPQWIVEYARLLVLLNKELGVKIMLASHNPDMVSAIRSISEREGVLDNTRFYIARPGTSESKYVYQDLGSEIGEIFTSFNIALDRIQSYGCPVF